MLSTVKKSGSIKRSFAMPILDKLFATNDPTDPSPIMTTFLFRKSYSWDVLLTLYSLSNLVTYTGVILKLPFFDFLALEPILFLSLFFCGTLLSILNGYLEVPDSKLAPNKT